MKKVKGEDNGNLRKKYKLSDFKAGFIRGKYSKRIRESSNIIVLNPEVARVFPNEESVNKALKSLIKIAKETTKSTSGSGRTKRRAV